MYEHDAEWEELHGELQELGLAGTTLTRRDILVAGSKLGLAVVGAGAGLSVLAGRAGAAPSATVKLNYFSWEPWARKKFLNPFEKANNVSIKTAYYSSGEEMLTKLQAGGSKIYDMLSPVNNNIKQLVGAKLTEPWDISRIPNHKFQLPFYKAHPDVVVDGKHYMIPFVWGTDTIAHNKKFIPKVDSWGVLFDKKYKGRIAVQDSAFETIALTAALLGYTDPSPFVLNDKQLQDVKKKLIGAKPLWRTIWTNFTDLQNLFISGEVWAAQGWLVIVEPIRKAGVDLGWAFVKEGSIGWFEGLTMVKGTKHRELLHKLANYTIGDLYPYLVYKDTGYYPTSLAPKKRMSAAEIVDSRLNKPKLPNAQHYYRTPPNFAKWQEVWNEVKAA